MRVSRASSSKNTAFVDSTAAQDRPSSFCSSTSTYACRSTTSFCARNALDKTKCDAMTEAWQRQHDNICAVMTAAWYLQERQGGIRQHTVVGYRYTPCLLAHGVPLQAVRCASHSAYAAPEVP